MFCATASKSADQGLFHEGDIVKTGPIPISWGTRIPYSLNAENRPAAAYEVACRYKYPAIFLSRDVQGIQRRKQLAAVALSSFKSGWNNINSLYCFRPFSLHSRLKPKAAVFEVIHFQRLGQKAYLHISPVFQQRNQAAHNTTLSVVTDGRDTRLFSVAQHDRD